LGDHEALNEDGEVIAIEVVKDNAEEPVSNFQPWGQG